MADRSPLMPGEEPRAEIVELDGEPLAWSGDQPVARPGEADGPNPGGRVVGPIGQRSSRSVIVAAGVVVLVGLVGLIGLTTLGRARPARLPGESPDWRQRRTSLPPLPAGCR